MKEQEHLSRVPLFSLLEPLQLAELARKLIKRTYNRGATIFYSDAPGSRLYIIESGRVKIASSSPDGNEVILAILRDGDFFGELSILDGEPRSATATAMETTSALTLDRADLLEMISKHPDVAIQMLTVLSKRLRSANLQVEGAFFLDQPTRLARRMLELAAIPRYRGDRSRSGN